jgi:energy-converting hydrogenase Eha subunit H
LTTAASTNVKSSAASATTAASPETGDNLDFALILLLMGVSLAGVLYTTRNLKKRTEQSRD